MPAKATETGQVFLVNSACSRNFASSIPGTSASVFKSIDVILNPPSPGIFWAALIYQTRNAPSGFAGYGDDTMIYDALGARRAEVMRLIGWRRPVAI